MSAAPSAPTPAELRAEAEAYADRLAEEVGGLSDAARSVAAFLRYGGLLREHGYLGAGGGGA